MGNLNLVTLAALFYSGFQTEFGQKILKIAKAEAKEVLDDVIKEQTRKRN